MGYGVYNLNRRMSLHVHNEQTGCFICRTLQNGFYKIDLTIIKFQINSFKLVTWIILTITMPKLHFYLTCHNFFVNSLSALPSLND